LARNRKIYLLFARNNDLNGQKAVLSEIFGSNLFLTPQNPNPNPKRRKPKNHFPKGGGKWFLPVAEIKKSEPKNHPWKVSLHFNVCRRFWLLAIDIIYF
jgi:hypothetical protein